MKIRTKLLLALSTLPILLFILVGTGIIQTYHLNKSSESFKNNYEFTSISQQISTDIKTEAMHLRNLVIFTDKTAITDEVTALETLKEGITNNIQTLEQKAATTEQAKLVASLKATNEEFNDYIDEFSALILEDRREDARALIDENSISLHQDFFEVIEDINDALSDSFSTSLQAMINNFQREIFIGSFIVAIGLIVIMIVLFKNIWTLSTRLNRISAIMGSIASGEQDIDTKVDVQSNDEIDQVARSFNRMTDSLADQMNKEQESTWTKANIADITTSLSGTHDLEALGQIFLSKVVPLVDSSHGVFYIQSESEEPTYKLIASYAFKERKRLVTHIQPGEGLIGQAILEKKPIILTSVPSDYVTISSGLGEATPLNLYVLPICFEGEVKAVLELASFHPYNELQQSFLEELINDLGIILESVMGRIRLAKLLEESQALMEEVQAQSEELQQQQEELKATNEELEEQTQALRLSEEKLQMQQEELEQSNADLEEKAKILEEQNKRFEQTNKEVEKAKADLEVKAEQLALSSKYKSEFLANMSHELRTPLNSLLILSKLLSDNGEENLTKKQLEYAKTIYSSGHDLLLLINDILDLAKIESGKMNVNPSKVEIQEIVEFVENTFRPVAYEKELSFHVEVHDQVPSTIYSDEHRLQQVLKNLLSNAFKFTHKGEVKLEISRDSKENGEPILAFAVSDTGIGISKEKQEIIFEAFQQADGTTSRKYGGTGLGLSISRELASLLGGEIKVDSVEGKGSTFTFSIRDLAESDKRESVDKEVAASVEHFTAPNEESLLARTEHVEEENDQIKRLLIVDDDKNQRNSLMELIGDMDFIIKAVSSGKEAIEELKVSHFDCMILDLGLKDTSGFEVLKRLNETQHKNVKVFVYTGRDLTSKEELELSMYAHTIIIKNELAPQRLKDELELYLQESHQRDLQPNDDIQIPTGLNNKKILLVDDDVRNLFAISSILELQGLEVIFAENGYESLKVLQAQPDIDLVLMDIMMPEMDGYEAIEKIREMPSLKKLPIIALTAKAMKEDREKCLAAGASDYIIKPIEPEQLISLIKVWLFQ